METKDTLALALFKELYLPITSPLIRREKEEDETHLSIIYIHCDENPNFNMTALRKSHSILS